MVSIQEWFLIKNGLWWHAYSIQTIASNAASKIIIKNIFDCSQFVLAKIVQETKLLYMCFDRFLLAVESRDLSQADKSVLRVSSFSILQNFNYWIKDL